MGREAYRDGAADAQQFGSPNRRRYSGDAYDPAYEEGFDDYMKEHPACAKCGGGEVKKKGDECIECMQESSECPPAWAAANNPETQEDN